MQYLEHGRHAEHEAGPLPRHAGHQGQQQEPRHRTHPVHPSYLVTCTVELETEVREVDTVDVKLGHRLKDLMGQALIRKDS